MFVETLITIVAIKVSVIFLIILDIRFFLKEKAKHGEWVDVQKDELYCADAGATITRTTETCSVCKCRVGFIGPKIYLDDEYCPNCGAKMDGRSDT